MKTNLKEVIYMILFTILAIMMICLFAAAVLVLSIGGAAFIAVFADVIVCAIFVGLIIRWWLKKRK